MRRAPVRGGPSSGKPYLVACPSLARLISRNRLPPPTRTIPASSIGPELLPVNGSWPPPEVVLVAAPTSAVVVVSSEVVGETLDEYDDGGLGDDVYFVESAGDLRISNATSTKQPLTRESGMIVLASDNDTGRYLHSVVDLGGGMPEFVGGLPDGGQRGGELSREGHVVVPDDGDVLRGHEHGLALFRENQHDTLIGASEGRASESIHRPKPL